MQMPTNVCVFGFGTPGASPVQQTVIKVGWGKSKCYAYGNCCHLVDCYEWPAWQCSISK